MIDAKFQPKLQCLFTPKRYKVLWGGRGAGRSWGCARALLIMGVQRPLRVLCAREFQTSIAESVHQLLQDQILQLGLSDWYVIQEKEIFCPANGTRFTFVGIKNNPNKVRSFEGADICWVEEANKVTKNSWEVLTPTIRKKGSEIWMTFNPELEEDYTYKRYVKQAEAEESFVVHMTYEDNPWFESECPELVKEMQYDRREDPDRYLNVWLGRCRQNLEGAVFANEIRQIMAAQPPRITRVPYDPSIPIDTYWDIGKRDKTAIWFAQRVAMQFRVVDYYENQLKGDVGFYVKELKSREYTYGTHYLPHDADHTRLGMPFSVAGQMRSLGFSTHIVPKWSKQDGINAARLLLRQCWIDEGRCEDGIKCLRHYRYKTIDGVISKEPDHDSKEAGWASHGADAFRYMAVMSGMKREAPSTASARVISRIRDAAADLFSDSSTPKVGHNDWMNL